MSLRKARQSRVAEQQNTSEPITPARKTRHSVVYTHSPLSTPSLSETKPFDWDAAKGYKPAPYQTPMRNNAQRRSRMSMGVGTDTPQTPGSGSTTDLHANGVIRKPRQSRVIIRQSWSQWLTGLPAQWWLRISMMHHDLPLPPAKTMGRGLGVLLHLLNALVKWFEISSKQKDDDGWGELNVESLFANEDDEEEEGYWLRWTTILTILLLGISITTALRLFTQTKTYDLQLRDETQPLTSPNITYVPSPAARASRQNQLPEDPNFWSYVSYFLSLLWRWVVHAWRFLIHHPAKATKSEGFYEPRIQQLEMWNPSNGDLALFGIYSPLHAVLWQLAQQGNWMIICFVMVMTTFQLGSLVKAYSQLIKDNNILHAEVLNEYTTKFVNPRLNYTKKDACVMTHESEMVDYSPRRY